MLFFVFLYFYIFTQIKQLKTNLYPYCFTYHLNNTASKVLIRDTLLVPPYFVGTNRMDDKTVQTLTLETLDRPRI